MTTGLLSTAHTGITTFACGVEYDTDNERRDPFDASSPARVIQWEGSMLRLKQRDMAVGHPYSFVLEGVPVVAIKRPSGDVDFYRVP